MKNGYLKPDQRKKILLICDDIRFPSGVANVGKELIINTCHHYNWVNIGGAINHPDKDKRLDISQGTNEAAGIKDSSVIIYPINGYGDANLIRNMMRVEKPDAIFLITDPRYFTWLFDIENEIRKTTPIIYLNIWDDFPVPLYNKPYYESCDALLGISKQTVLINKLALGDKTKGKIIEYVPHGINTNVFYPLEKGNKELQKLKDQVYGKDEVDFTLFFNSRNIRRKQIPDTLLAFKYFLDKLPKEKADKCRLLLHTELVSEHGTNLIAVRDYLFGKKSKNIIFSTSKITPHELNKIYNLADAQILLTSNEGWGLSLTEALLTGTPIIANVTGGMQDQMRFEDEDGKWFTPSKDIPSNHTGRYKKHGKWAFPVYPTNRSLQGSPPTPYIWDDRCRPEDAAEQIMKLYNMSPEERKECGKAGYEWVTGDEAGFTGKEMGDRVITHVDTLFETWKPREKYEFINVTELPEEKLMHELIY
jgi:glycosyltransferase involved in cell wall biosynthesis